MLLRAAIMAGTACAASGAATVLVGGVSGTQGAAFSLAVGSGALQLVSNSSAFGASPAYMALSADRAMLYVTNHGAGEGSSGVTSLAVAWGAGGGVPSFTFRGFSACDDPAHIALHASGAWAATASYSAGTVSLFAVDAARSLRLVSTQPAGANAHQVVFARAPAAAVYVPCLGADAVAQFTLDTVAGVLAPLAVAPRIALAPGSGPRHMAIAPDGRTAWVLCELSSTLVQFGFDADGSLVDAQLPALSTVRPGRPPADVQAAAAIVVSDDGKFIYVSNRASPASAGDNSVLALAAGAGPAAPATPLAWADAGGAVNFPRDIALLQTPGNPLLVVASQHGNALTVFARDAATGNLTLLGANAVASAPVLDPSFVLPLGV